MNNDEVYRFIQQILEELETNDRLSEWESNFVASVRRQFKEKGTLSPRQREVLERIYDERE